MKKVIPVILLVMFTLALHSQENEAEKEKNRIKKINIGEAYVESKSILLISPSDISGKFFVTNKELSEEIVINGAEQQDSFKTTYTNDDRMYLSAGDNKGVKQGDIFTIYRKGALVNDPYSKNIHGRLYQAVAKAKAAVVYENRSIIEVFEAVEAVEIGNIVLPVNKEQPLLAKRKNYLRAKLPEDSIRARVIHMDLSDGTFKHMAGSDDFFIANIGKEHVERGDMMILYKVLREDLPPLIFGDGVVVNVSDTCCTIKILACSEVVEPGHYVTPFPKKDAANKLRKNEKVPEMSKPSEERKAEMSKAAGFEMLEAEVYYELNKKAPGEEYKKKFDEIKEFISKKSEYLIILRGYTCSIGNAEYNLELSRDRVMNLKKTLVTEYGLDEKNIETYFYGEKETPHDNSQESERRKNRLVTVEVSAK